MIPIYLPKAYQEIVLQKAGYLSHITQKNGLTVYGWVMKINEKLRWHIVSDKENWVNLHQDYLTKNNRHVLQWRKGLERQENDRITNIYRTLFPRENDPYSMKVKGRGEFAPNLKEIQQNHKSSIPSPEMPIPTELSPEALA